MTDDHDSRTTEAACPLEAPCQPYQRPVLMRLGSLRDITLAISTPKGNLDGKSTRRTGRGGRFDAAGLAC